MNSTRQISKALGQKRIAEALGVTVPAVSMAAARGGFPASWYPVVRAECEAAGIDCPMAAFNWRASPEAESGGAA